MPIRVYLLQAPYAIAAGTTIVENVKAWGKLPAAIQEEYGTWLEAHTTLGASNKVVVRAHEIDPALDRAISTPATVCTTLIAAYTNPGVELDADQQRQLADATLVRAMFPADLRQIVNLPFTEEWAAVRKILQQPTSDAAIAAAIERLALKPAFALATRLHEAYGRALGVSVATPSSDVDTRLSVWNTAFSDLIVAARYLNKKTPGLFEVFSAPYEEQLARQQAVKASKNDK